MVLVARVILLGSMLLSSAYAAEPGGVPSSARSQVQEKVAAVQQEPSGGRKAKSVHKKANKAVVEEKAEPKATAKQDRAAETPIESQSVQLRGVRG